MNLTFRSATTADIPVITEFIIAQAFESEALRLDPDTTRRGVEHGVTHPEHARYFVAEQAGQVVGQLMLTYEWSDWRAKMFWWIQSVYVHPDFRGRGVFQQLYRQVESLARQDSGVCGLRLYVHLDNHRAMAAYEKLGMKPADYRVYKTDGSGLEKDKGGMMRDE